MTSPNIFQWSHTPQSDKATLGLIIGISLLHLLLAGRVNLSVDEAHYALYGLHLDWSYFDHPPLVGWLNALPAHFFPSDTGMRLLPILFYAVSNWLLYRITLRLFPNTPAWLGFISVLLLNSGVMFQLLSQSMLPDTPLMLFALLVFWQLLNLLEADTLKNWVLMGVYLGFAGLSKYTAITLVLPLLLIALLEKRWAWLSPKKWGITALVALLLISPVLYWNATHDWISILYQLHHGTHNPDWSLQRVLTSQAIQLVVYNPVIYLVGLWLVLTRLTTFLTPHLSQAQKSLTYLVAFALPTLLLFGYSSGYEMTLPHWTQLAWLFLTPAVAYLLWQNWHRSLWRRLAQIGTSLSVLLALLLLSEVYTPWMPLPEKKNPVQELHGWPEAVAQAQNFQRALAKAEPNQKLYLFVANWTQASHIAWYGRPQPVFVMDNRFDQFDLWFGNPPAHSSGIVIVPTYESADHQLQQLAKNKQPSQNFAKIPSPTRPGSFEQCAVLPELPIVKHQQVIVRYHSYLCQGFVPPRYQGWVTTLAHLSSLLPRPAL